MQEVKSARELRGQGRLAVPNLNSPNPAPHARRGVEIEALHPAIQSTGLIITSAAAQLMTLVRPAPLTLFDTAMEVRLKVSQALDYYSRRWNNEVPRFYYNADRDQHTCC